MHAEGCRWRHGSNHCVLVVRDDRLWVNVKSENGATNNGQSTRNARLSKIQGHCLSQTTPYRSLLRSRHTAARLSTKFHDSHHDIRHIFNQFTVHDDGSVCRRWFGHYRQRLRSHRAQSKLTAVSQSFVVYTVNIPGLYQMHFSAEGTWATNRITGLHFACIQEKPSQPPHMAGVWSIRKDIDGMRACDAGFFCHSLCRTDLCAFCHLHDIIHCS